MANEAEIVVTKIAALKAKAKGKSRVVFVSGNFDVVHPGHLRFLNFASDCGDILVVGVNSDSKGEARISESLRIESLRSLSMVDYAFILRESAGEFIEKLKPDFVVKGKEYEELENEELNATVKNGGKLLFSSGDIVFSSRDLLRKELEQINYSSIRLSKEFPVRHRFDFAKLKKILAKFTELKVTVLGDLIIDDYITCEPLGMSQEDPTIVVAPIQTNRFLGGAGIVAAHARALGAQVKFFCLSGLDEAAGFAKENLSKHGVDATLFEDETRPTTLKQRFRAHGKTLLRVSHLKQHEIDQKMIAKILPKIIAACEESDLVIFSDFSYGFLSAQLVNEITRACVAKGIKMVGDSQSSSQVGDILKFKNTLLITPTEREARLALQDFKSGLVVLANELQRQCSSRNVIITLGSEGILAHSNREGSSEIVTDQLPAFNSSPKDVAGAGDSLLTCSSLALVAGASIWESAYLGSVAAACQVSRTGNIPLSLEAILQELSQ